LIERHHFDALFLRNLLTILVPNRFELHFLLNLELRTHGTVDELFTNIAVGLSLPPLYGL